MGASPKKTEGGWSYPSGAHDPDEAGWHYGTKPEPGTDGRKLVTLEQGGMVWIGIRFWQSQLQRWVNNGEPIIETVIAWQDLPQPAPHRWSRGLLV